MKSVDQILTDFIDQKIGYGSEASVDLVRIAIEFTIQEMTKQNHPGTVRDAATAHFSAWNYDMSSAPIGVKCLLLNAGGVACIGNAPPQNGAGGFSLVGYYRAWAPLPRRDKAEEARKGFVKNGMD